MQRRSARKRAVVSYREPGAASLARAAPERWQADWQSDEEEESPPHRRDQAQRESKRARAAAVEAEKAEAAAAPARTAKEREADLLSFLETHGNANTQAAYASGWRQFERWAEETENPRRVAGETVDVERPLEAEVAHYMVYMVEVKRSPMSSVATALAAIANHLRFVVSDSYHPTQGKLIDATRLALSARATPSQQKTEVAWPLLQRVLTATETGALDTQRPREERARARRDGCLIALAYFFFLRGSEVARMRRSDVSITSEAVDGATLRVLRVHVNRLCKNDTKRLGHERVLGERPGSAFCMLRTVEAYLATDKGSPATAPLFPLQPGGAQAMHADTPRGRLRHWLEAVRQPGEDPSASGFHSLRAGGASEAAHAGVAERLIKLHGNWKSDAVRLYMRPDMGERLAASAALGQR
jgi:integrase